MIDVIKRNNVTVKGEGSQPIVFVHGYGCDQSMWRFVAPAFESNYKVILIDLVGSGKSDSASFNPVKYSSLKGYAEDILEICDALKLKDVIYVGHSVSSIIGALASIVGPDFFSRLVMIGPSPKYVNDVDYIGGFDAKDIEELLEVMENNYLGWSSSLAPAIMGNPDRPELGEELVNSFCQTDPKIAKIFARTTFLADNRRDLSKVTVPTLILQCAEDIIAPVEVGKFVHESIPNSKISFMEATGHCPHLSEPKETVSLIKKYLTQN